MSRVFVSCAYRDRAVGARVEEIVRTLGHEPLDDLDELDVANGETWWNAVVDRIEDSEVFLAVVGHRGNGPPAADPAPAQPGAPTTVAPAAAQDLETQVLAAVDAAGSDLLPASSCGSDAGRVTCRAPASNIRAAVLTAYPTRRALYDAYTRAVQRLSGDPAPRNEADCTGQRAEGEVSWNLDHDHRTDISVDAQVLGGLDPASEAAGRVFCTESSDVVQLVWTQDPGLLVTATGQPAAITMAWWDRVHLSLACASGDTGAGCG